MFGLGINKLGTPRDQALPEPETLLFANDEEGTFLDFTTTQVYADTAGTDPAEVGEGIALTLDKSQGLELGPELVTNGTFDTDTGWNKGTGWSIGSGVATFALNVANSNLSQTGILVANQIYEVTYTISNYSGTGACGLSSNATTVNVPRTTNGTYTEKYYSFNTTLYFRGIFGGTFDLDNISVRELKGVHALQATSAARPIFGRVPVGGRRNLLLRTEEFDNAFWEKSATATVTANQIAAPDNTTTADLFRCGTTSASEVRRNNITLAAGNHTFSVFARKEVSDFLVIQVFDVATTSFRRVWFNINLGSTGSATSGGTNITPLGSSIEPYENGFYRVSITVSLTAGTVSGRTNIFLSEGDGVFSGNALSGIYIWGAQLDLGSTATPYQKVVTQYDITEAGVPSIYKAFFDKADDILPVTLPTITGGTVALVGTSGIWIEEDWGFTAGTLSIGPTTIAGLPAGILSVVGDLCAVIINDRAWTAAEYAGVVSWGKARGAPGVFALGGELVTNGTFDADITGWTNVEPGNTDVAWDASNTALSIAYNNGASNRGHVSQAASFQVGELYVLSCSLIQLTGTGTARILADFNINDGNSTAAATQSLTAAGDYARAFTATSASGWVAVKIESGDKTVTTPLLIDNISLRKLELLP
jgi:hypothetical protein